MLCRILQPARKMLSVVGKALSRSAQQWFYLVSTYSELKECQFRGYIYANAVCIFGECILYILTATFVNYNIAILFYLVLIGDWGKHIGSRKPDISFVFFLVWSYTLPRYIFLFMLLLKVYAKCWRYRILRLRSSDEPLNVIFWPGLSFQSCLRLYLRLTTSI